MQKVDDERAGLPSASSFRRYELCAGSWQMEQKARAENLVANEGSAAATRGEKIHEWLAGEPVGLDAQDLETAEFLLDRADAQIDRIFGSHAVPLVFKEERLWLKVGGKPVLSGRFDRLIRQDKVALIQDYKTGRSAPERADTNAQLKVLAVLAAVNHPNLEEVYVQLISRNAGVTEAVYGIEDLHKAFNEIHAVLTAIRGKFAELTPGLEQCKYCTAVLICPKINAVVTPAVEGARSLPEGKEAGELLDLIALAETLFSAARKHYTDILAEKPDAIPGYALAPGAKRREITDWPEASRRLGEILGPEAVQNASSFRLSEVEALLANQLSLKPKEAQKRFNELLEGLVEWKRSAPVLTRLKNGDQEST